MCIDLLLFFYSHKGLISAHVKIYKYQYQYQYMREGVKVESIFDEHGYLPAGFNQWILEDVGKYLVNDFPESNTRKDIFSGYLHMLKLLEPFAVNIEQWLDGSFCTTKLNPNDLDLLTIMDKETIDNLPHEKQTILLSLFQGPENKYNFKCDSYFLPSVPPDHPDYHKFLANRSYWKGQFGFDREDIPKGIVQIVIEKENSSSDSGSEEK